MTASSHSHIISNPCKLFSFSHVRSALQGPSPGNKFSSIAIPWTHCNLYTPSMFILVMDETDPGGGKLWPLIRALAWVP